MTFARTRLAAIAALTAGILTAGAGTAAAKPTDPTLILPSVWISETDSGKAPLYVNIALDRPNPLNRPVSVIVGDFTTRPVPNSNPPRTYGTATPGQDYLAIQQFRLTWAPGQRVASFPITLLGDTLDEAAQEEIDVRFSGPDGVHIADNDIDVFIRDNDPLGTTFPGDLPVPKLTNSRAREGDAGCAAHRLSVHLSRPNTSGREISVGVYDYTTVPVAGSSPPRTYGDATPGADYVAFAPFRLSFAPGATAATFRSSSAATRPSRATSTSTSGSRPPTAWTSRTTTSRSTCATTTELPRPCSRSRREHGRPQAAAAETAGQRGGGERAELVPARVHAATAGDREIGSHLAGREPPARAAVDRHVTGEARAVEAEAREAVAAPGPAPAAQAAVTAAVVERPALDGVGDGGRRHGRHAPVRESAEHGEQREQSPPHVPASASARSLPRALTTSMIAISR